MILFIIIIEMIVVFKGLYIGGLYESGGWGREIVLKIKVKYIIEMIIKESVKKCAGKLYVSVKKDEVISDNIKYAI